MQGGHNLITRRASGKARRTTEGKERNVVGRDGNQDGPEGDGGDGAEGWVRDVSTNETRHRSRVALRHHKDDGHYGLRVKSGNHLVPQGGHG